MPSLTYIVVRIAFARVMPSRHIERMARSTAPGNPSGTPERRMSAVIHLRPHKHSGRACGY